MNERQIFEGALEFTAPADRQAFLDKACGGDVALRTSVEALLATHNAASRFLNVPAVEQLQGGSDKRLDRTLDHSVAKPNDEMDNDEASEAPDLSFLQASTKPGSIGSLGHYEILQVLGQGAFGIVFRAFDEKLHRQVAVKAMNPQLASTSPPRKRFLREARSVAAIKHENIVQIYSVEEQPLPYLVMEFVQGQTLQQKLDGSGPLDVPEILHLGRQMAAGLAAAHALSMIHRDIKPGNILLEQGAEQKVKITDFGLARAADDASMTNTGVIAGTPLYMSPEQAEGRTLDARSDLFSLGSVLYQMATGRPPFRAPNTIAVLRRVVEDTPRPLSEIIADLPPWLETIVLKLLEKDPVKRYQSAKEVTELFARCQHELEHSGKVTCVTAAPAPPAAPPNESAATVTTVAKSAPSQNRWLVAAPALLVVFLLGMYLISRAVERFYPAAAVHNPEGHSTQASTTAIRTFPSDEWIDVIPLIEPRADKWGVAKQTGLNNWRIEQGELIAGGDALACKLLLPLDSDWPAYECELEFTRRAGESGLNVNLPTKDGECPLVFDPPGYAGVHLGNRQQGKELQAGRQIVTGKRTTLRVEVHRSTPGDSVSSALHGAAPWEWTGDLDTLALAYRENFPQDRRISLWIHRGGEFAFHRIRVKMLDGGVAATVRPVPPPVPAEAPKTAIAPFSAPEAKAHQVAWAKHLQVPPEYENSIGMKFRLIPPGECTRGGTTEEIEVALQEAGDDKHWQACIRSESPRHQVTLTQPIFLGVHEVTQGQYERILGKKPVFFAPQGLGKEAVVGLETSRFPVEMVSWNDAVEFSTKLSAQEKLLGKAYRLPTEAEWEFACRAGTTTRFASGEGKEDLAQVGWFGGNAGGRTHAVGELPANPFGFFDLHGNVMEWVQDGWSTTSYQPFQNQSALDPVAPAAADTLHVLRGGHFYFSASACRSSFRYAGPAHDRGNTNGFRVALTVDAVRQALNISAPALP